MKEFDDDQQALDNAKMRLEKMSWLARFRMRRQIKKAKRRSRRR